ncbi:hypothetical protein X805_26880 [Sphaerotilus natans subsp. natans DSM 6575]|uniref:Uncharacterized protein n=1 Tax=Sphaerotilus natans subsp. natans DSM 6575 TaxID=1286631 RepID=A0A059KKX0_9BURK|nr:hypothetical protein X805_26880 [Sphaerotilus natans subsp. natans DSM 6575]
MVEDLGGVLRHGGSPGDAWRGDAWWAVRTARSGSLFPGG